MNFRLFVLLYFSYHITLGTAHQLPIEPGSCSRKCQNVTADPDQMKETAKASAKFPCSCSSSCSIYKDCCYDSAFSSQDLHTKRSHTMCLSVSGRGQYKAISKCPKEWSEPSHFCTGSIGHLPPVTSTLTGATYANIYCAICHNDGENLKTWKVDLRCCSEHDETDDSASRHFVYRRGHLWSRVTNRGQCLCRYQVRDKDSSFLDALELRSCERRQDISKCSSSWHTESDEKMCKAFLDPIFLGDKTYRNIYCARCNYEELESTECEPEVVASMRLEGADIEKIYQYCLKRLLRPCLYYLTAFNKGRNYSFSNLLRIREQSCIPEQGERCCQGERFDFKAKRCRKLTS